MSTYCVLPHVRCFAALTFPMYRQRRGPHVIVRASVRDDNHDLTLVGFGFAEELVRGVRDGGSRTGSSAPVVYALDSVQQVGFVVVLSESELQPLLICVLYDSYTRVRVRDLELPRDVGDELEHGAEVPGSHAAGAVDDEGDVVGVQAGLAAHQAVGVTHTLHQRLNSFTQIEPARDRERVEAVGSAHSLQHKTRNKVFLNPLVLFSNFRTKILEWYET